MNIIEVFGSNLKKYRLIKGVTQDEIGAILGGVSRAAVSKIECGKNKSLPSIDQITKIAWKLGVEPGDLLGTNETSRFTARENKLMDSPEATKYIKEALVRMERDLAKFGGELL